MSAGALYREMGLEGYRIDGTSTEADGSILVSISVPRELLRCRRCGCGRVHLHESRQRSWKGAPLGLTPVVVTMKTPRVKCLECGSRTWHQPTCYISAVIKYLPKARLVFDHFHVIKLMNEKLTTLRRDLYRELTGVMRQDVLKGIRWLLLKNPENLQQTKNVDEKQRLEEALQLNKPLATAYYLKEDCGSSGIRGRSSRQNGSWKTGAVAPTHQESES